ncbi:MAG: hypothetical protein ACXVZH_10865 [Terriglobales bacterium]
MRTSVIVMVLAASLLVACNKSSEPAAVSAQSSNAAKPAEANPPTNAKPADAFGQKLQEIAGSGAKDCGRLASQAPEPSQKAGDCAMTAAKDKHAFYVAYDMPGLTVGVAGNSEGKLFSVQAEQAQAGGKAEVHSAPCPSELRIAQSGRVTCMKPGAGMPGMGGGASPHGAMPPASGENPHGGGMSMPPPGTSNPHGSSKPATPPKQ